MEKPEDVEEETRELVQLDVDADAGRQLGVQEDPHVPRQLGKRLNLYVTAGTVNILSFLAGIAFAWMSTMQSVLQGAGSPVGPISDMDASWLAAIVHLSRLFTIPFYMYAVDRFGRKNTGCMVAAPFVLSYGMSAFATSLGVLCCARFIAGVAAGGACILAPAYVSDVAEDANKGRLGLLFGLSLNLGFTFAYSAGHFASYAVYHHCCLAVSAASLLLLRWLPESPLFLMAAGRQREARDALRWLRDGDDCDPELERLAARARQLLDKKNHKMSVREMLDRPTRRALLLGLGLMANQQLSGNAPVLTYTVSIFEAAGSTIPPNICTILVGMLTTTGTLVSSLVIERCGRRQLLIASDAVFCVSLGILGTYFYLRHLSWDVTSVGWLPLTCLSAFVFTTGMGFSSLPFTVVTEIVGPHARGFVQTAVLMFLSALVFTILFCYGPASRAVGQHGCFWFFSAACAVAGGCIYLAMPETKNRSLEEVVAQLDSRYYVRSVLAWSSRNPDIAENKL